ncbi:hypothetical protein RJ639_013178 [Escallonia herrerae]|uniref:F-box domain-containing protein n=1 Tax=Escallonia herrerae TaxID=1293975 RepID=A0AA88VHB9_9ASTE|nr:hypothetical protein RJ639_013178 [Escallonia herrerae]
MGRPHIPIDTLTDILSWLPVKSLKRFSCVCKPWRSMLENPTFIAQHLKNSALKTNGGCLLLIGFNSGKLDLDMFMFLDGKLGVSACLSVPIQAEYGVKFSTNDYELVRVAYHCYSADPSMVALSQTLASRKCEGEPLWTAYKFIGESEVNVIVGFNMVEEVFCELAMPELRRTKFAYRIQPLELKASLGLIDYTPSGTVDIWVMNGSWTKQYRIAPLSSDFLGVKEIASDIVQWGTGKVAWSWNDARIGITSNLCTCVAPTIYRSFCQPTNLPATIFPKFATT